MLLNCLRQASGPSKACLPCLRFLAAKTNTGLVGDKFPSASVRGIDISPIQPLWVPPNVSFLVDDAKNEWLDNNVDLAHFRFMALVFDDAPKILGNAFQLVSPPPLSPPSWEVPNRSPILFPSVFDSNARLSLGASVPAAG